MTNPTTYEIEEFRVSIPQADLDDLADLWPAGPAGRCDEDASVHGGRVGSIEG